jgi:uncharacterized protein YbaP (TraB family)
MRTRAAITACRALARSAQARSALACRVLAGAVLVLTLASPRTLHARPAEDQTAQLDELTVTGERAGPGLWHVHRGTAQLWIFGTVSPLPKDMTWRSKQLESIFDSADQLLVAKPVEVGIARAMWLMVTQRSLLMAGHGKKLKDLLPPDLYARFARQRARFTDDPEKWERYRPLVASAFLEEEAFHRIGLSTRLDLAEEVRSIARKHHVRIEEFKIAGLRDILDALKSLPPATEQTCVAASLATLETGLPRLIDRAGAWATGNVERIQSLPEPKEVAACRAAITMEAASGDLYSLLRRTWIDNMKQHLQQGGVTVAVVSMDMLLEPGGFLDALRAAGYEVEQP